VQEDQEQTFNESPGLPQRQAEKSRAKAASKAAKNKKKFKYFYTEQDGKLLRITAKPNGAYSEYIAKKPKPGKDNFETKSQEYKVVLDSVKKDGLYVSADMYEETIQKMIANA